jgi:hypothetical protein
MLLVSPTGVSGTAVDEYDWRAGRDLRFLIVDPIESLKPTADQPAVHGSNPLGTMRLRRVP